MYSRDFTPLNQQIPEIFPQLAHHNMTANTAQIDEGYAAQNMPRPHVAGPNAVHAAPYSALQGAAYLPPRPEPIVTAAQSHPLQNGVAAPSGRSSTIDSLHNAGNAHRITNTRDRSRLSMSAQRNPGNHIAGTQQQHSISKVLSNSARGSPKVKPYSNLYSSDEHAAASLMLGALRSPKRSKYIPMGNWEKGRSIPNAVQNAAGVKAPTQQDIAGMINDSQHDSTILQEMGNYYPPNVDNEGHFSARTGNRIAGNEGPLMSVPSSSIGAFKEEMM